MKKYLKYTLGFLIGATLAVAVPAAADILGGGDGYGIQEAVGSFVATATGNLNMTSFKVYSSTVPVNLGTAATTGHSLATGDVIDGGKLEVDGTTYLDGAATVAGALTLSTSATSPFYADASADPSDTGAYRCGNAVACITAELASPGTDKSITLNSSNAWAFVGGVTTDTSSSAPFFIDQGADAADSGVARLSNLSSICWEASPAAGDVCINVDASENFNFTGSTATNFAGSMVVSGNFQGNLAVTAFGDLQKQSAKGTNIQITQNIQTLTCSTSSTLSTTTAAYPVGAIKLGSTTRITTALTGATGFQVGDGTDDDHYGVQAAATLGSTTGNADATASPLEFQLTSAGLTKLTFTGVCLTGAVRVTSNYMLITADSAN